MFHRTMRSGSRRTLIVLASAGIAVASPFILSPVASAQSNAATANAEVRAVMESYITASRNSDEQLARSLFHPNAIMTGAQAGGKMIFGTPESFFGGLAKAAAAPTKSAYGSARVVQVTVVGEIAAATVEESNFHGKRYTDMFQLVRYDRRWLIISKTYYGMPAE